MESCVSVGEELNQTPELGLNFSLRSWKPLRWNRVSAHEHLRIKLTISELELDFHLPSRVWRGLDQEGFRGVRTRKAKEKVRRSRPRRLCASGFLRSCQVLWTALQTLLCSGVSWLVMKCHLRGFPVEKWTWGQIRSGFCSGKGVYISGKQLPLV